MKTEQDLREIASSIKTYAAANGTSSMDLIVLDLIEEVLKLREKVASLRG